MFFFFFLKPPLRTQLLYLAESHLLCHQTRLSKAIHDALVADCPLLPRLRAPSCSLTLSLVFSAS
ncbi:GPI-anchored surface protein, putative [Bodo saltans]|uniref:GPI-anchored surface protein, putative n=1 Tax=Bodo saltans TaxID=75058 RepID=A0A0S4JS24_BODSA|nr:GPI-anchored surface protein, putative [Bodo saltans]|eukprot:CUG92773.1 GPI-anchored surface protein, putative [Bodo saltans]